jgi:hypothetical protein
LRRRAATGRSKGQSPRSKVQGHSG